MTKFRAQLSLRQNLAGSFHYLRLELLKPHRIDFQAGQYLILTIDEAKGIRRNYSIASSPSADHVIELLVDLKPQGPGSKFLARLQPGDQVEFLGPVGNFVVENPSQSHLEDSGLELEKKPAAELLFIATGSGIAPLRAMTLDQLVSQQNPNPIRLWWGMRHQQDCFWVEDFDVLEKEHRNFKWDLILSKPPENWPLHSGHVTEHVLDYVKNKETRAQSPEFSSHFYLCGNQQMIEELLIKLKEFGIKDDQIHFEKFF